MCCQGRPFRPFRRFWKESEPIQAHVNILDAEDTEIDTAGTLSAWIVKQLGNGTKTARCGWSMGNKSAHRACDPCHFPLQATPHLWRHIQRPDLLRKPRHLPRTGHVDLLQLRGFPVDGQTSLPWNYEWTTSIRQRPWNFSTSSSRNLPCRWNHATWPSSSISTRRFIASPGKRWSVNRIKNVGIA